MPFYFFLAQAQQSVPQAPSIFSAFFPMVLIGIIMYVILIKPQQKKQKEHLKMVQHLKVGDKVVTSGGIHGTIAMVKEQSVFLKIADNVKIEINRESIGQKSEVTDTKSKEKQQKK